MRPIPVMHLAKRLSSRHARHAAAIVEFAVVAPLFLLLVAGIIEFGQAFRIQHSLSNGARLGARLAIVEGATVSSVTQKIQTFCSQTLSIGTGDVTVAVTLNGAACSDLSKAVEGDSVNVAVSIPFSKAGVGFYSKTFANVTLKSSCTMGHE